jgi:hypothetical protein
MKNQQFETIKNFIEQEVSSTNLMLACRIALKLMPYSDALVELIETKNIDNEYKEPFNKIIVQTICHDYNGLMSNDEDFLPRLKANKKLSDLVNELELNK